MLRARLQRPADLHAAHLLGKRADPSEMAEAARVYHDRRVPGHRRAAVQADARAVRLSQKPLHRRRPGPDDLHLARREPALPARLRQGVPLDAHDHDDAELPLHAADPRGGERADREERLAHQERARPHAAGRSLRPLPLRREQRGRGEMDPLGDPEARKGGRAAARYHGALPRALHHPQPRGAVFEGEAALYDIQRRAVLRPHGDQGRAFVSAHALLPRRLFLPAHGERAEAQSRPAPHGLPARIRRQERLHALRGAAPHAGGGDLPRHEGGQIHLADRILHRARRRPPGLGAARRHPARERL